MRGIAHRRGGLTEENWPGRTFRVRRLSFWEIHPERAAAGVARLEGARAGGKRECSGRFAFPLGGILLFKGHEHFPSSTSV